MSVITPQVQRSWTQVRALLNIQNERDYDLALERLNGLIYVLCPNGSGFHPQYSSRIISVECPPSTAT